MNLPNKTTLLLLFASGVLYAADDWTQKTTSTKPSARNGHAMAYIGGHQVLLLGGSDGTNDDETWVYDLNTNTWTQKNPVSKPSARNAHSMAYIGDDQVILFGGYDGTYDDETWVYDLSDNTWTQKSPSTKPSVRYHHDMAYIGDDHVLLFGGWTSVSNDETWVYDLSDNTWTQKSPTSKPSPRFELATAYISGDKVLLFSGQYADGDYYDDTWIYDLSTNTWIQKNPASKPSPRAQHAMAYIGGDQVLLFSGRDATDAIGGLDDETWVYDLSADNWIQDSNTSQPSARTDHAISETSMDGSNYPVLFGGWDGANDDETWTFGGGDYLDFIASNPPQSLTATPGNTQVTLTWTANSESDLASYKVYGGTSSSPTTLLSTVTSGQTYTHTSLTNGTTYYYRITAVDNAGNESGYSSEKFAMPHDITASYSLSFDGTDDYVDISNISELSGMNSLTVQAWIKKSSSPSNGEFLTKWGSSNTQKSYVLYEVDGSDLISFFVRTDSPTAEGGVTFPSTDLILNTWHQIVGTYDGTDLMIYLDGQLKNTSSFSNGTIQATTSNIKIGTNVYPFNGKIDEVAIWNAALSSSEITSLYNSGAPLNASSNSGNYTSSSNLKGYWRFNENTGTVAHDFSVNGNHGTISGATWSTDYPSSDQTAPTITSVTSTTADGTYKVGDVINTTVNFSEVVTLSGGNLIITLETGTTDRTVTISSISSATSASGSYTVQSGDVSSDLSVNTIALSSGTLKDAADNTMTDFSIPSGQNLKDSKAIVVDGIAPSTPTNLTATPGNTQVTLTWTANSESDLASYKVYGGTSSSPTTLLSTVTSGQTYTHSSLTNGTTYYYRITAVDNAGNESGYSNEVSATPGLTTEIISVTPAQNALDVSQSTNIFVIFGVDMNASSINANTFVVHASQTGLHSGMYSYDSGTKTATFNADSDFKAGEVVTVTLTTGIQNANGDPLPNPYEWSFTIEVDGGTGIFQAKTDYTTGSNPISVFSADLDGDGDLDLTVANYNSNTVSVFMNNGDGTFTVKTDYAAGDGPHSVFSADLDGDGDMDLAMANTSSNNVSVFMNNGDGTFAVKTDYTTGSNPISVFSADLDGDGDLDLTVANYSNSTISVLLNNGDGTFAVKTDYTTGSNPISVFSADLDGDGDLDLMTANWSSNTVSVLLNRNREADIALSSDTLNFGTVKIGSTESLQFTIYNNGADGTLQITNIISSDPVFAPNPTSASVLPGDSTTITVNFTPTDMITYSDSLTIFSNDSDNPEVKVHVSGEGDPIFSHTPAQNALNVPANTDISVTFNDDVDPATINDTTFVVHASQTGLHSGMYSYDSGTKTATFNADSDFKAGEVVTVTLTTGIQNANGDPLPNPYEWSFTIEVDGGTGIFQAKTDYTTGSNPISVFSADLDGDGDMDLAVANGSSNTVSVLLNNGDGTFAVKTDYTTGSNPHIVFSVDLDGDGDLDLAVVNYSSNTVSVLLNNGDGTFASKVDYATGTMPYSVFSADLDGDGDLDLMTANWSPSTISVLLNNGDGTFAVKTDYTTGSNPISVFSADLDGDGDLDLMTANWSSNTVSVLLNRNREADIALSSDTLNFGSVKIDSTKNLEFNIYNNGVDSTLQISNIHSSNTVFVPTPTSASVLPGDSTIITVNFTPTNFITYNDSLTIYSDDPNKPEVKVYLQGTGVGTLLHVSTSGSDSNIGSSDYPFATIQAAIDYSIDSDTVLVHPGTYVENINFNGKNIVVGSLFLTTGDTAFISQTVIDGNQNGSVVRFVSSEDSTTVLSGFTIINGSAGDGGGIICSNNSNPNLVNLKITGNTSSVDAGGIDCVSSNPNISNVIISDNTALNGGGIVCVNSNPRLNNVLIYGNTATNFGGGMHCNNSNPVLVNVTISGNISHAGGGAIDCYGSNPILINTILWNDSPQEIRFTESGNPPSSITVTYSDIDGGESGITTNNNGTVKWLNGNIDTDPLFVDASNGDYRLSNASPLIAAGIDSVEIDGTWYYAPKTDIEGNPRPNPLGTYPDMSAYENPLEAPGPGAVPITDGTTTEDVDWSNSSTTLSANWEEFPSEAGIDYYEYAIGDHTQDNNVADWTQVDPSVRSITRDDLTLENNMTYHFAVKAIDIYGTPSSISRSDGVTVDTEKPVVSKVIDSEPSTQGDIDWLPPGQDVNHGWRGSDNAIIANYEYSVGTSPGSEDIVAWSNTALDTFATSPAQNFSEGTHYSTNVRATDIAGNVSDIVSSDGFEIDGTAPGGGTVRDSLSGDITYSESTDEISCNWSGFTDDGSGINHYEVAFGSTPGGTEIVNFTDVGDVTNHSHTGLSLEHGSTYYASVRAIDQMDNVSEVVSSDGFTVDIYPGPPSVVQSTPDSGSYLSLTQSSEIAVKFSEPVNYYELDLQSALDFDIQFGASHSLDSIVIMLESPLISLDTIQIYISNVTDFGGLVADETIYTYYTDLLGDYTSDLKIDVNDLSIFVEGWTNKEGKVPKEPLNVWTF